MRLSCLCSGLILVIILSCWWNFVSFIPAWPSVPVHWNSAWTRILMTFLITYAFCLLADCMSESSYSVQKCYRNSDVDFSIIVSPNLLQITMWVTHPQLWLLHSCHACFDFARTDKELPSKCIRGVLSVISWIFLVHWPRQMPCIQVVIVVCYLCSGLST